MDRRDADLNMLPGSGGRRISGLSVLIASLIVAVTAAAAIGMLREQAAKSHRTQLLLAVLKGQSQRLNYLEWQAAATQRLSPRIVAEMQKVRDQMMRTFHELMDFNPSERRLEEVLAAYRDYEAAVKEEMQFIAGEKPARAEPLNREFAEAAFDRLSQAITTVNAAFNREARDNDRSAFIISVLVFLGAAAMIGLLFWRFQRARQAVELMAAEQRALRWSEERFRSLIQNASDIIILLDTRATVSYVSDSVHRTLGYRPEELIGTQFTEIVIPDEVTGMREYLAACLQNPAVSPQSEFRFRHAGGHWRQMEVIVDNRLHDRSVGKLVINCRDITERKTAEEQLRRSREQLRSLSAHLQSVREEERTNIAREIHDELGQTLTSIKMDVSWLGNKYRDHKSLAEKTGEIIHLIDSTIRTVKRISAELRPVVLDDLGLTAAIEWQAEEFQKRSGIECEVKFDPEDITMDKDRSTAVFRIFQEALTNVARHAEATKVNVCLEARDGSIHLSIRDNGKGITEEQIYSPGSFGLIGIQERAHFWGGDVEIRGERNEGTMITVRLPVKSKAP